MNCPHCKRELTDAEVKALWASYCGKRQTKHAGPGRPLSCQCGDCSTCKRRAAIARGRSLKNN